MTFDATPDTPADPRPVDPDILAVLEYVSRGRRYVGAEPYPDFQARRALGRLHDGGSHGIDVVPGPSPHHMGREVV